MGKQTQDQMLLCSDELFVVQKGKGVFCTTGLAHADWPEGPHKEWLESLQRPDNDAHPYRKADPKSLLLLWRGRCREDEVQGGAWSRPISERRLVCLAQ